MPMRHSKVTSGLTALNATVIGQADQVPHCREHAMHVTGSGAITAGAVQLESAHSPDYTGTWNPEGAPVTPVSGTTIAVKVTGHFKALRGRISTAITGGGSVQIDLSGM